MKILLSAYACEPDKGSEPGVGWNWVKQIARFHEVWVITRANNRVSIERALAKEPMANVCWIYFDLPTWARFWKRGQRGVHLYYYLWQIGAYFVGKRLHKEVGFDLIHHVTFVNYWMPSFLAMLSVPFVWGPVGGGESAPKAFYKTFSLRGLLYECVRDCVRWLGAVDPFVRLTARHAQVALATTADTVSRLHGMGAGHVEILSQVALPGEEFVQLTSLPVYSSNPFRLLSIGRVLHWKGFHLGLSAFFRFQQEFPSSEYWFIGDGPEQGNLQRLAQRLGVSEKVRFWGSLPRERVLEKLAECDILVHPSLHDSGGRVCLEAMAAGRPVICLDLGGPALQITKDTGIKIPAMTPGQAVDDLAEAMCRFAREPDLRRRMGEAARIRAGEYFDWGKKGEWIEKIYQEVCQRWGS